MTRTLTRAEALPGRGWTTLLLAACAAAAVSCATPERIGRCGEYTSTAGTARITAVERAPADQYNCPRDPVRVLFAFTPAAGADPSLAATGVALTIGAGENPPRAWVEAQGLTVGSKHPAVRLDEHGGACTPLVWKVTDVDTDAGLRACY
jgi:hypothetical protein